MNDEQRALSGVQSGRLLSLYVLLAKSGLITKGKLVEIELNDDADPPIYRLTFVGMNGHVSTYRLNALTAEYEAVSE